MMQSQKIVDGSVLHRECKAAIESLKRKSLSTHLVGESKGLQELRRKIKKVSSCKVSILISGESGTGKEVAARAIHHLSSTRGKPFIPVNCGAIPESLFENELFGHAKGAFTGAGLQQIGLVKEAEHGTLFLDEIGVLSQYLQVKLLRLLQNREYRPVGESKSHYTDVRVVAATNRDLQSLVGKGLFRDDLFYRLSVVSLHIPPLRERKEDIPVLAKYFLNKYAREYNKEGLEFSRDAMRAVISYSWPGNVRELENKIQQIVVMSANPVIDIESIELPVSEPICEEAELEDFSAAKKRIVSSFEKTYLTQLLTEHGGDVVSAARAAGKSRTGLWNLLAKHKLSPRQFRRGNSS